MIGTLLTLPVKLLCEWPAMIRSTPGTATVIISPLTTPP